MQYLKDCIHSIAHSLIHVLAAAFSKPLTAWITHGLHAVFLKFLQNSPKKII